MIPSSTLRRARGFTLVEAIIVIVITGILGGMVAVFIRTPVQSYIDTAARAELSDVADLTLRRISREVRLALPNSLLVSADGRTVMFLLTKTGGRYIDVADGPPSTVSPLSFSDTAANAFHLYGAAPTGRQAIAVNDFIVVYNLGLGQQPADAYSLQNVARVTAVNGTQVTFSSAPGAPASANPFAANNAFASPTSRFQVVSGTVAYQCSIPANGTGTLTRFASNTVPLLAAMPATPPGTGALMASMVAACEFRVEQPAHLQAALVTITLTLRHANGESVRLVRQVHVDNTP